MRARAHRSLSLCAVAALLLIPTEAAEEGNAGRASASGADKSSQRVSGLIRAELPAYAPADLTTFDAETTAGGMKDGVFLLPTMTVKEVRKAPPSSTDWLTADGRLDYALRRFPGTKIGNFRGLNNPWAEARLAEDIEAERHAELKERGADVLLGDSRDERETRALLKAALAYSGRGAPK